jgi:FkbM family methyltransferase
MDLRLVSNKRVGLSVLNELRKTGVNIYVVLDVGANIGQSSLEYAREFPNAKIHAFEPIEDNYRRLKLIEHPKLIVNKYAMGESPGRVKIFLSNSSQRHSSVVISDPNRFEKVEMTTVDRYCTERSIDRIGFLKVDTEGADLAVLKGAKTFLGRSAIDFIQVETSFYRKCGHVFVSDFLDYLAPFGYNVLGLYDQNLEWDGAARIQFANLLFAREGIFIDK